MPRVMAFALPATHDIKAFVELGEQLGDLRRIVLQIAVDRDNSFAVSSVKTGAQCRRLAKVAPQPYS